MKKHTNQIEHMATVVSNETLAPGVVLLTLDAPVIAASAMPGQFVHVACNLYLRRPFGIAGADPRAGTIQVGIQIKGEGTRDLAGRRAGDRVSILGPLGSGFQLDGVEAVIAVAGGTGLFPLAFLLEYAKPRGIRTAAFCGYRSADTSFLTEAVGAMADEAVYASDAGDFGFHGTCVDALCDATGDGGAACQIGGLAFPPNKTLVAAIGPMPMMHAAYRQAARLGIPCQVSLEERMACGIGVCLVCACKTQSVDPLEPVHHARCCADGPVFRAEEIVWD